MELCTFPFIYSYSFLIIVGSKFSVWRHLTTAGRTAVVVTNEEKETQLKETCLVCKLYNKCISLFSQVLSFYANSFLQ